VGGLDFSQGRRTEKRTIGDETMKTGKRVTNVLTVASVAVGIICLGAIVQREVGNVEISG